MSAPIFHVLIGKGRRGLITEVTDELFIEEPEFEIELGGEEVFFLERRAPLEKSKP